MIRNQNSDTTLPVHVCKGNLETALNLCIVIGNPCSERFDDALDEIESSFLTSYVQV